MKFPYRQVPHPYSGSSPERQRVGDPGHCEDCVSVGHVKAHPDLGCGDVGCTSGHGPEHDDDTANQSAGLPTVGQSGGSA